MAWVQTNEDPRFHQLRGGDTFTFNSGKPEEDYLKGFWLRIDGPVAQTVNAVRITDGAGYSFAASDRVEYCYLRINT